MTKGASAATASRRRTSTSEPATRTPAAKKTRAAAKKPPKAAGKAPIKRTMGSKTEPARPKTSKAGPARPKADKGGPGIIATLGGISSAAVAKATGYGWDYWLKMLDKAGAATLPHREIASMLYDKLGLRKSWWAQMIAVGYEQARGLRKPNQGALGFAATVSRTIAVPVSALYAAMEEGLRGDWLPDALEVRRATKNKSMRVTWPDGSGVDVNFYAKGGEKAVVAIEQKKLPDEGAVEAVKQLWGATLDRLKSTLEGR